MKSTYSKDLKAEALVLAQELKSCKSGREAWYAAKYAIKAAAKSFDSDGFFLTGTEAEGYQCRM